VGDDTTAVVVCTLINPLLSGKGLHATMTCDDLIESQTLCHFLALLHFGFHPTTLRCD